MEQVGRLLVIMAAFLAVVGVIFMLGPKLPFRIGRLPLDFHYQRDNFSFYFPLGTSILISLVLTLVFALFRR
jgi:hypothetical protein